ncbi:uncharacterized protein LOC113862294 [Abrus precatorius]|uniref:Uncharacterized protein LOC113862294 n=1 Tax=Abrus precatorius TaxID=3816 RepID=A0A8B8L4P8_ABRPR|nr:uncharacterized protein LOC113862294 [Abrus precatorius]
MERRSRERGKFGGYLEKVLNNSTSYVFTNFPFITGVSALWQIFQQWEKVVNVFISQKSDKLGRRFDFVHFMEVADAKSLEAKLKSIIIGRMRLYINLMRHAREKTVGTKVSAEGNKTRLSFVIGTTKTSRNTYAEKLKAPRLIEIHKGQKWVKKKKPWAHLEFEVDEGRIEECRGAMVERLYRKHDLKNMRRALLRESMLDINLTTMGDDMVLVKSDAGVDLEDTISLKKLWWEKWFYDLREWHPNVVAVRRVTWVRCYGVPLHAWSELFFRKLVSSLGDFIQIDQVTTKRRRLDYGRIQVGTTIAELIKQNITMKVNDRFYSIVMLEEHACDVVAVTEEDVANSSEDGNDSSEDGNDSSEVGSMKLKALDNYSSEKEGLGAGGMDAMGPTVAICDAVNDEPSKNVERGVPIVRDDLNLSDSFGLYALI